MFCAQFRMLKNLIFGHFSRILDNRQKFQNTRVLKGFKLPETPVIIGI